MLMPGEHPPDVQIRDRSSFTRSPIAHTKSEAGEMRNTTGGPLISGMWGYSRSPTIQEGTVLAGIRVHGDWSFDDGRAGLDTTGS
jgi:hypothetical protein